KVRRRRKISKSGNRVIWQFCSSETAHSAGLQLPDFEIARLPDFRILPTLRLRVAPFTIKGYPRDNGTHYSCAIFQNHHPIANRCCTKSASNPLTTSSRPFRPTPEPRET